MNLKGYKSNKAQAGNANVVGLIVAIVVGGVLSIGSWLWYQSWQEQNKKEVLQAMADRIITAAPSYKQTYGSFAGFSNSTAFNSQALVQPEYKSATTDQFTTPYSPNGLAFAPVTTVTTIDGTSFNSANAFLGTTFSSIPKSVCSDFVSNLYRKVMEVRVGTTRIPDGATATSACAAVTGSTNITMVH